MRDKAIHPSTSESGKTEPPCANCDLYANNQQGQSPSAFSNKRCLHLTKSLLLFRLRSNHILFCWHKFNKALSSLAFTFFAGFVSFFSFKSKITRQPYVRAQNVPTFRILSKIAGKYRLFGPKPKRGISF